MSNGLFIAFEGIDGSGKSTHIGMLSRRLEAAGIPVHTTAEPTNRPAGKLIRDIFAGRLKADQHVIAALFAADRLDHLTHEDGGMLHQLAAGFTVITDRYFLSSYAYHGVHVDAGWVTEINSIATGMRRPDITFYLDVAPEVSMSRIRQTRQDTELYETLSNLKAVHALYEEAIERFSASERIVRIDGNRNKEAIASDIWEEISRMTGR